MTAASLKRKWKMACTQSRIADESFQALSESIGEAKTSKWKEEEENAQACRDMDVTAMDIFDVNEKDGASDIWL